jgi:cytochrome b involved in lipid metabolism
MKLLGLLLVAGLLTGCASVDASDPIASNQSQPLEVAIESPSEVPEESATELDGEEADASMVEPETEPEESAPAKTQSVQPSATKAPPAAQEAEPVESQAPKQTQEPAPSPEPEPEPVESKYSMANIAKNNSTSSCWAAISGKAYNLTDWISKHPGGAGAIVSICGTDATSVFQGRHGGQSGPASSLSAYLLGDIDS